MAHVLYNCGMTMDFAENLKLDRNAWLRLLGVSDAHLEKAETDERTRAALERLQEQMDEAEQKLFETAQPAFAYAVLDAGELPVEGESLAKHLEGVGEHVVDVLYADHLTVLRSASAHSRTLDGSSNQYSLSIGTSSYSTIAESFASVTSSAFMPQK